MSFLFGQALESLNKKDMTEIKSYGRPPALVETVMQAVMILLCKDPTWAEAKRQLGEGGEGGDGGREGGRGGGEGMDREQGMMDGWGTGEGWLAGGHGEGQAR